MNKNYQLLVAFLFLFVFNSTQLWAAQQNFSLSGVLETEASAGQNFDSRYYSSASVAKMEVQADSQLNKDIELTLGFKFEDETSESGELDKVYATINNLRPNWQLSVGRQYLYEDFFHTYMVTDAITKQMIELRMEGVNVSYANKKGHLNVAAYKSPLESNFEHESEVVLDFARHFAVASKQQITLKGLYTSNIIDSQSLAAQVENTLTRHTQALGLGVAWRGTKTIFETQCVKAIESVDTNVLQYNNLKAQPAACQIELGREINFIRHGLVGLGYQWSDEALALQFPQHKFLVAMRWGPMDNLGLALEVAQSTDYSETNGGSGNVDHTLTAQLAIEF